MSRLAGPALAAAVFHAVVLAAYVAAFHGDLSSLVCVRASDWDKRLTSLSAPASSATGTMASSITPSPALPGAAMISASMHPSFARRASSIRP